MSFPQLMLWLRCQTIAANSRRKAIARDIGFSADEIERLEDRQLLSAAQNDFPVPSVSDCLLTEVSSDATDISHRKTDRQQVRSTQTYPSVAGVWNLTAAADIDDDPTLHFSGTVVLVQKGRKIGGSVDLDGLPDFKIRGKLDKSETFELKGSTRFPIEVGDDKFHFLSGKLTVHFSPDVETFNGSVHRVIFGHHIDIALSATRI